jgi:hypothetical protein
MAIQPIVGALPLFSFIILYIVGVISWTGDQPFARPVSKHSTTRTQDKHTETSMPRVGLKPTTPAFERAKIVHVLDLAAVVNGCIIYLCDTITTHSPLYLHLGCIFYNKQTKQTPWSESASELHRPSDRRLSAKWLPTFADRGCHVVSVTDPYCRILDFLDRSCYFSIK